MVHKHIDIDGKRVRLHDGPNTGEVIAHLDEFYTSGRGEHGALVSLAHDLRSLAARIDQKRRESEQKEKQS